jgi:hypothetical protein
MGEGESFILMEIDMMERLKQIIRMDGVLIIGKMAGRSLATGWMGRKLKIFENTFIEDLFGISESIRMNNYLNLNK